MFWLNKEKPLPPSSSPPDPAKLEVKPEERQILCLPDKRDLGFATYGSTKLSDPVIFLFHGLPGSRIVGRGWDTLCKDIGARLITMDRPGCGLSTFAERKLTDWPGDVVSLADHLGVERFSVLGASGGGPFALACARFIPQERLRSTTVVCGIGPMESLLDTVPYLSWRFMGLTPWALRLAARHLLLPSLVRPYCTTDAARLKRVLEEQCTTPEEKAQIEENKDGDNSIDNAVVQYLEAFKQGTVGAMQDGDILTRNWGFDLKDVDAKKVWMVHGDQDTRVPLSAAQWVNERLGGDRLRVLEGKTHFTIWKDHSEEIFRQSAQA